MSRDEEKTDDLFDRLAGKIPRDQTEQNSGVEVLREALRAQIDTVHAAEQASRDELSVKEKAQMDVIKHQLLEQGLIGVARTVGKDSSSKDKANWIQRLQELVFGTGWERPFALALSMLFVIAIGVQVGLPPDSDPDFIVRGGATPEIITSDPSKISEELAMQLREVGAQVLIVKINADDLTMRVDVPSSADLSAIKKIFMDKGITLEGYPPYRLKVKQSP